MKDRWTEQQTRIFEGLSAIGQEIAGFYESGLNLYFDNYPNGAYLMLHAAREIDGGLRDVLAVDYSPDKDEPEKHKNSILFSLGEKQLEGWAEDWFKASKELHRYAHRRGAWKPPRQIEEARPVWDRYEKILEHLVGSYYAIIERIERIGKIEKLKDSVIETLSNILKIPTYYNYFFGSEKNIKWFFPLKHKKYFELSNDLFDKNGNALFWNVLDYLERISVQVVENPEYGKELIDILESIVRFSKTKPINNYHIWWYCVKILYNLPIHIIKENLPIDDQPNDNQIKYGFKTWLETWTEPSIVGSHSVVEISKKLLPKFLEDNATIRQAEAIITAITRIRPIEKKDLITDRQEATLGYDPDWLLDAFKKHHEAIGQKCSVKTVLGIANTLKNALEYKRSDYFVHCKVGNAVYRLTVLRIENKTKKPDEISFLADEYNCIIAQFAEDQIKDGNVRNDHWLLPQTKPEIAIKQFPFSGSDQTAFVEAIKSNLRQEMNWPEDINIQDKVNALFGGLYEDYSQIWLRSLSNDKKKHTNSVEEILTIILRDVLLAKCGSNREEGLQILNAFLKNTYKFAIFKRLALHCPEKYWDNYPDLLETFFRDTPDALKNHNYEVELYDVLNLHNAKFTKVLVKQLKSRIADVPNYYLEKGEEYIAHWKRKWLSPLREQVAFKDEYKEIIRKVPEEYQKPYEPERFEIEVEGFMPQTPLKVNEILIKPVPELMEYLDKFQDPDKVQVFLEEKPDREGLAMALQAAVKENPDKFTQELETFLKGPSYAISPMFRGFKEVWLEGNKPLEWEKIIDFCLEYLSQDTDTLLNNAAQDQSKWPESVKNRVWVIDDMVELIEQGCRNDGHAFDPKLFDKVDELFNALLPYLPGEKQPDIQQAAMDYVINTTLGKTIETFVVFSLRKARAAQQKSTDWGKAKYERFFEKGIEACIWFGRFLPQIRYLDKKYAEDKIRELEQKETQDIEWTMFMEGYLSGKKVYKDIYLLMRPHYTKALKKNDFKDEIDNKLVEHITLSYLENDELLQENNDEGEPSFFWKMLHEGDMVQRRKRWLNVPRYFWMISGWISRNDGNEAEGKLPEEKRSKIIGFWKWTYEQQAYVQTQLGEKYAEFLQRMSNLTILLDKIDNVSEPWLLLYASHIDVINRLGNFMEYLTKFEDVESIKRIGRIFRKVLEKTTPTYKQEDIELIVRRIYEKGDKNDADAICNSYGRRGGHFLRQVYNEHQEKE